MLHRNAILAFPLAALLLAQCNPSETINGNQEVEHLSNFRIEQVRLHDGVPLTMQIDLRWQTSDPDVFKRFQVPPDSFPKQIILPRTTEALRVFAHNFHSVDSVFFSQRQYFLEQAKETLTNTLQKDGITVSDVIITSIDFPKSYVDAMEAAGLQRQEMERIKRQTAIAIAEAEGERKKTEAQSLIAIAQEQANARVRDIQSSGENSRRLAELNRAETEVQLEAKKTIIAADRQRQMDGVELDKMARQNMLVLQKTRQIDSAEVHRTRELAKVFGDNPDYAGFVVNKELASKVSIAVVPNNPDQGILNHFLDQNIKKEK